MLTDADAPHAALAGLNAPGQFGQPLDAAGQADEVAVAVSRPSETLARTATGATAPSGTLARTATDATAPSETETVPGSVAAMLEGALFLHEHDEEEEEDLLFDSAHPTPTLEVHEPADVC
jgi:hypothetical protein